MGKKPKAVFNEHCKNTVWRFPNGRSKLHPTEKNLRLFEYLIKVSSNENNIVFDPCIGSGTTAVACEKLNRKYIGFDINPDILDAKNIVFCFGKAIPNTKILAVRPRSIAVAELKDKFVVEFMEAPNEQMHKVMEDWALALAKN